MTEDYNYRCADCYRPKPRTGWAEEAPGFRLCAWCAKQRGDSDEQTLATGRVLWYSHEGAQAQVLTTQAAMNDMTALLTEALDVFNTAITNNNPSNVYVRVPQWAAMRLVTALRHLDELTRYEQEEQHNG